MFQPGTKVLLIADDPAVHSEVAAALTRAGAGVRTVCDGAAAVLLASSSWQPDVVVVDLLLSTRDCYVAFRALRLAFGAAIIVGATNASRFGGEVDEVIPRPIDVIELAQRIAARRGTTTSSSEVICAGDLRLMPRAGKAFLGGEELPVSADEMALFERLAAHLGREVCKDELRGALRGLTADVDPRMVDVHLVRMMVKLEAAQSVRLWRTAGNDAYVLSVEQREDLAVSA